MTKLDDFKATVTLATDELRAKINAAGDVLATGAAIDPPPPPPPPVPPSLSVVATDAAKSEGNSGVTPFTFTVTRTGDLTGTTTVDCVVVGSGTNPADAADFGGAFPSVNIAFASGEATKAVVINVSGDTAVEIDENFSVTLSNVVGGTIAVATAVGAILNDDVAPPPPPPPNPNTSPDGARHYPGTSEPLTDRNGSVFLIAAYTSTPTQGMSNIFKNGAPYGGGCDFLTIKTGVIWCKHGVNWFRDEAAADATVSNWGELHLVGPDDNPPPPPPPPPPNPDGQADVAWLSSGPAGVRVIISCDKCPAQPAGAHTLGLDHDYSWTDPASGAARAAQLYAWCGAPPDGGALAYVYGPPNGDILFSSTVGNPAGLPTMPQRLLRESDIDNIHFPPPLPPPGEIPAHAAERGLNVRTFASTFNDLSKVDLTGKASGMDWYGNVYPGPPYGNPGDSAHYQPINPDWVSVSGGVMLIADDVGMQLGLQTIAVLDNSGPFPFDPARTAKFVGRTFKGNMHVVTWMSVDTHHPRNGSWPAIWCMGLPSTIGPIPFGQVAEGDLFECIDNGPIFTAHDWNYERHENFWNGTNQPDVDISAVDWNQPTKLEWRHVRAADNAGVGLLDWWVNDLHVKHLEYRPVTNSGPEHYSVFEDQELYFIINAGQGWPIKIKSFDVYQGNAANMRIVG